MLKTRSEVPQMADFIKKILKKYNATPDEWENFYSICDMSEIDCFKSYNVKTAND